MSGDTTIKIWRACGLRFNENDGGAAPAAPAVGAQKAPACKLLSTLSGHTEGIYTNT